MTGTIELYIHTSCKRSVARRVIVSLTLEIVEKAQYNKFFVCKKKKITMHWSQVKTFEFVCYCFYCLMSIFFLFCLYFCKTNFDVFTIFSELSGLKGNVLFMEIYIITNFHMLYNFGVSDTLTRRATLRLQLVLYLIF